MGYSRLQTGIDTLAPKGDNGPLSVRQLGILPFGNVSIRFHKKFLSHFSHSQKDIKMAHFPSASVLKSYKRYIEDMFNIPFISDQIDFLTYIDKKEKYMAGIERLCEQKGDWTLRSKVSNMFLF